MGMTGKDKLISHIPGLSYSSLNKLISENMPREIAPAAQDVKQELEDKGMIKKIFRVNVSDLQYRDTSMLQFIRQLKSNLEVRPKSQTSHDLIHPGDLAQSDNRSFDASQASGLTKSTGLSDIQVFTNSTDKPITNPPKYMSPDEELAYVLELSAKEAKKAEQGDPKAIGPKDADPNPVNPKAEDPKSQVSKSAAPTVIGTTENKGELELSQPGRKNGSAMAVSTTASAVATTERVGIESGITSGFQANRANNGSVGAAGVPSPEALLVTKSLSSINSELSIAQSELLIVMTELESAKTQQIEYEQAKKLSAEEYEQNIGALRQLESLYQMALDKFTSMRDDENVDKKSLSEVESEKSGVFMAMNEQRIKVESSTYVRHCNSLRLLENKIQALSGRTRKLNDKIARLMAEKSAFGVERVEARLPETKVAEKQSLSETAATELARKAAIQAQLEEDERLARSMAAETSQQLKFSKYRYSSVYSNTPGAEHERATTKNVPLPTLPPPPPRLPIFDQLNVEQSNHGSGLGIMHAYDNHSNFSLSSSLALTSATSSNGANGTQAGPANGTGEDTSKKSGSDWKAN